MIPMEWNLNNTITPSIQSLSNVVEHIISSVTKSKYKQLKVESATEQARKCLTDSL